MRELSLFTGAGGGVLGTKLLGWRNVGYVEIEQYCQEVIRHRIDDGILDAAPIFGDVRRFVAEDYARRYRGLVDVVTAGFPCQPFSVAAAGKQLGENDPRNMWPATLDVIRAIRPPYCFLENVPGLRSKKHGYFGKILSDLASAGYDARWRMLSAHSIGAPHRRDRLWIVAHLPDSNRVGLQGRAQGKRHYEGGKIRENKPNFRAEIWGKVKRCGMVSVWEEIDAEFLGNDDGVAHRLDRLKALGNGQVPAVAALAWLLLTEDLI